jgi:predicted RNase H-like HicB family nuclease
MTELQRFPLRIEQSKLDGWWFIAVDDVPGLSVFGSSYEDLLDQLKVAAVDLLRTRGDEVIDVEIVSLESGEAAAGPWVPAEKLALQEI